jgi:hypothetical protein
MLKEGNQPDMPYLTFVCLIFQSNVKARHVQRKCGTNISEDFFFFWISMVSEDS